MNISFKLSSWLIIGTASVVACLMSCQVKSKDTQAPGRTNAIGSKNLCAAKQRGHVACETTPLDLRPFSVLKERPKLAPELERLHQAGALVETDRQVFEMVSRIKGVQPVYLAVENGGWMNAVQERLFVPLNKDPKTGKVFLRPKLAELLGHRRPESGFFIDDMRITLGSVASRFEAQRDESASEYALPDGAKRPLLAVTRAGKWSNANVCYGYQPSVPNDLRSAIENVFADIQRNTPVRFHHGAEQCEGHALEIHAQLTDENLCGWADVGMNRGGRQELHLRCTSARTISHELFHTLGSPHEQSRVDRDDYVLWIPGNTKPEHHGQFHKDFGADAVGPYNWRSIVHYRGNAFSNGGPTLLRCPHDSPLRSCADAEGRPRALTTDGLSSDYPNDLDWDAISRAYCDGTAPASRCTDRWPSPPGARSEIRLRDLIDTYYERPYTPRDERELPIHVPAQPAGTRIELRENHGVPVVHYGRNSARMARAFPYSELVDGADSDPSTPAGRRAVARVYEPETGAYRTEDLHRVKALCVGIKLSDEAAFSYDEPSQPCFPHDPQATSMAPGVTDLREPGYVYHWIRPDFDRHLLVPAYTPPAVGAHQLVMELDIWGYGARPGRVTPFAPDSYVWGMRDSARHVVVTSSNGAYLSAYPRNVSLSFDETSRQLPIEWRGGWATPGLCSALHLRGGSNLQRFVISQRGTGPVNVRSIRITGPHPNSFRVLCFSAVPDTGFPFGVDAAADVRALGVVEFLPPIAQPALGSPFGDQPWEDDGYPEAPWGFFGNVEFAQLEIEGDSGHVLRVPLQGYVWGL